MHVMSGDLVSEKLKHKKHYNSFHPKLGFFLHIDEILSWFDAESTYYQNVSLSSDGLFLPKYQPILTKAVFQQKMVKLSSTKYEPLLKSSLSCFRCHSEQRNIPTLKKHLQDEWLKLQSQSERKKRKLGAHEAAPSQHAAEEGGIGDADPPRKKTKSEDPQNQFSG
jgi:aprataxin